MMETLMEILPVIIDVLLIILLIIGIILGIKCINIINKANNIITDVEEKIAKFNSVFAIFEIFSKYIDTITDKLMSVVHKIKTRFTKNEILDEEEEIENIIKKEGL